MARTAPAASSSAPAWGGVTNSTTKSGAAPTFSSTWPATSPVAWAVTGCSEIAEANGTAPYPTGASAPGNAVDDAGAGRGGMDGGVRRSAHRLALLVVSGRTSRARCRAASVVVLATAALALHVSMADDRQAGALERPHGPPGGVDHSSSEGEPGRRRCSVMVVVQALAQGDPRQPLVVAGEVLVGLATPGVPDGVDGGAQHQVGDGVDGGGDQPQLPAQDEPADEVAARQADECVVEEHSVPGGSGDVRGI